jgi:hypothetical protein
VPLSADANLIFEDVFSLRPKIMNLNFIFSLCLERYSKATYCLALISMRRKSEYKK